jgi:DNA-binding IclR family transcriptional regulator
VPAVGQATRLLFSLANSVRGEASLTELAGETGIVKSQVLAILNTLGAAGLVTRDKHTKNYALGTNIVLLYRAFTNNTDLARVVTPYLQELAAETGCTVLMGLVVGETLFIIARRHPPGGVYLPIDSGHRFPLIWGAHGKAYLAALPAEEFERRLARDSILEASVTDRIGVDRDTLRLQVDECRRLGYGKNMATTPSGPNTVSAVLTVDSPDTLGGRHVAGCIVALGFYPPEGVHKVGCLLIEAASEISQRFGPLLQAVNVDLLL